MTQEERVKRVVGFGFTHRQAAFLVEVMLHSGFFVGRQYCTFARIARGQKLVDFLEKLTTRRLATPYLCGHNKARVYHLHSTTLYDAIERDVQEIRGLDAKKPVPRQFITTTDLKERLTAQFDKDAPPAYVAASERLYKALGLTNSYLGLVIVYTVVYIPFAVWLLVGFLRDFPVEIEEAALIDGCSRLRALVSVVMPIIAPGLAVVALFAFIATWNEFLFAVVLTGIETKTMMVLVTSFTSGGTDMFYGEASASVVLGVLPAFAVAFLLQRYLVKGLALGGTKG